LIFRLQTDKRRFQNHEFLQVHSFPQIVDSKISREPSHAPADINSSVRNLALEVQSSKKP